MRQIVMFNWVTADGFFAAPDGNLDWVVPDEEQAKAAAAGVADVDTFLFGRRTYEQFEKFWGSALDESATAEDPHDPGQRTREHRAIGMRLNEATKLVFSKTLKDVTWRNSRIVREFDPHEIEALKTQPGKTMMIFGSGSIVSQLTEAGLIDEYQFAVCPVLLGSGRPLFAGVSKRWKLDLLEARKLRSGNVILRYAFRNELVPRAHR
jgi:dihydrofolate reductase